MATEPVAKRFANLRARSLPVRALVLGLTVLVLYALVSPVALYCSGIGGLRAAAAAAAVCLAGAMAALVVSHLLRGPKYVWYGLLLGMFLRTGIPLGAGVAIVLSGGALAEDGILLYLLVFYPVVLALEAALSLPSGLQ